MKPITPPLVSVVIPTYNHKDFVLSTLDSVFAQTFSDYEVIVVNDGSPDDTAELLRPLAQSGRIRYVEQANAGQAHARNRGIALARGTFIALLDDDDLWPSDKLEWQVGALRVHSEAAVVYGRPETINAAGEPVTALDGHGEPLWLLSPGPGGDVWERFVERNRIISPGQCLIRRGALLAVVSGGTADAPFDAMLGGCDDWDLWLRLAENHPFLSVDRVALRYRMHSSNASRDLLHMRRSTLALYDKHVRRHRNDPARRSVVARTRFSLRWNGAEYWLGQALAHGRAGDRRAALRAAGTGIGLCPAYLASRSFRRLMRTRPAPLVSSPGSGELSGDGVAAGSLKIARHAGPL